MSRSVKKGPYVEAKLLNKIQAMNAANEKKVVKTWSRSSTISSRPGREHPQYSPIWSVIPSRYMTDASTCPYILPRT